LVDQAPASRRVIQERAKKLERQADDLRKLERTIHAQHVARQMAAILHVEDALDEAEQVPAQVARAAPDRTGAEQQPIDLLHAAMLIALLDDAEVDIQAYVDQVDRMATEVKASWGESPTEEEMIRALDNYLFLEQGYHGSRFDYENRANSYLNRVLTDREGIPISLSVLYMELGRRLGLKIEGIGLPGHFVVRYSPSEGAAQMIDVFHEAKRLDRDALEELTARYGYRFHDGFLKPERPGAILTRMLNNLQRIAEQDGDRLRMLGYLELIVAIDPTSDQARGMRAVVRHETGHEAAAIADLDWILEHRPSGLNLQKIEQMKAFFSRDRE
jgi:serine protease Do